MAVPLLDFLLLFIALSTENNPSSQNKLYIAIKNGDQEAFRSFYEKHFDGLYVFLRNRNISRNIAEDLIQKSFLYIWENREKIKPDLSLKAYLFRIAYTKMLDHIKQQKNFDNYDPDKHINEQADTPHDAAEYNDLYQAFHKSVAELPERRRMVFESCFLQNLTYKETAEILSISVKTVENHMALAFKDLRESLKFFDEN